jgi:hypothetical protein
MGICADCSKEYPYLQRAHIVAKHKGGTRDPSNIILVCPNCHHLRDRADRVAWIKKRWATVSPKERSRRIKKQMAALTPEQREDRARKISRSKMGWKPPIGHRMGGARPISAKSIKKRSQAVKQAWANKTPEEREAWRQRCREIKQRDK